MSESLKFTPFQLFIESSFFTRLSSLKLEEFKLDTAAQTIWGHYPTAFKLTRFNNYPVINLDYHSFDEPTSDNGNSIYVPGQLHLVNTLEEFKKSDKQELLAQWGAQNDGPLQFHLYCFADLKKYKFYSWMAVPCIQQLWEIISSKEVAYELPEGCSTWFETSEESNKWVFVDACLGPNPAVFLKNFLVTADDEVTVINYRRLDLTEYQLRRLPSGDPRYIGWERSPQGKMAAKVADLGSLIDPQQLASQAVDLNLKLMKWRIAPDFNLDAINRQKVLLLGAGTLGSYVARALLGWGVRHITFVDNGRVLYSNPVRQPLFNYKDCFSDKGQGALKAHQAAEALKQIFPGVNAEGVVMQVPMIGHEATEENYHQLEELIRGHDAVFLLMDSRELRWLPTLMAKHLNKVVINAALGFDSYLVMRHGLLANGLGCYYCNDVVAPTDSLSDRTLDQMCTVTRPGGALMAAALAVEVFVLILQHPECQEKGVVEDALFSVPHQIRGFLSLFEQKKFEAPAYVHCLACLPRVLEHYLLQGWHFISRCLMDNEYLEHICGLAQVKEEAEAASQKLVEEMENHSDAGSFDDEWFD